MLGLAASVACAGVDWNRPADALLSYRPAKLVKEATDTLTIPELCASRRTRRDNPPGSMRFEQQGVRRRSPRAQARAQPGGPGADRDQRVAARARRRR